MPWGIAAAVAGAAVSSALAPSPSGGGGGGSSGFAGLLSAYMTQEQANAMQSATDKSVTLADPFAQSRQMANTQLQSLMSTPGQLSNDPASQWEMSQGLQAANRGIAAKHQTNSGNAQTELMQFGQGLADQQYNNRVNQLSTMASQGASPSAAANNLLTGTQVAQGLSSAAGTGAMSSLGSGQGSLGTSLGNGISNLIGGYNGPTGALPQYSTGNWMNPTGYDTGIGGSGYTVASTGGYGSQQSQMLASQW